MHPLYQFTWISCHIVTQIVKTELIVGSKSNVGTISFTTSLTIRLMFINAIHTQAMELVKRPHPLRVTFRKVIIHRHHVYTISCQCIQEYRQSSHKCLTLTSCHFRNFSFMEHNTTEQLYIVMYHVPDCIVSTGTPMIEPNSLVTFYTDEIFTLSRQVAIKICCSDFHFTQLCKSTGCILYYSKSIRQHFIEGIFITVKNLFLQFVNLSEQGFTIFNRSLLNLPF